MFLSFAFTQIPELSTNNSPFKSSDPIKNLRKRGRVSIASDIWSLSFGDFGPGLTGGHRANLPKRAGFGRISRRGRKSFRKRSLLDCAPRRASPFDARPRRALEACSAYVARTDSGRPCAMQSYAVGCVQSPSSPRAPPPSLHPRGRTFFTPRAFPERVAKRWGRVALEGRAPPTRRTIRTDAPGPPNPSVIPSGTPRSSHDRRRTSSGPRAPRREVRPVPKLFPSPHGHLGRAWTIVFFFSPRPLALPRGRAPSRRI